MARFRSPRGSPVDGQLWGTKSSATSSSTASVRPGHEDLGDEAADDGLVALDLPGRHGIQDVHGSVFARRGGGVKGSPAAVERLRHPCVGLTRRCNEERPGEDRTTRGRRLPCGVEFAARGTDRGRRPRGHEGVRCLNRKSSCGWICYALQLETRVGRETELRTQPEAGAAIRHLIDADCRVVVWGLAGVLFKGVADTRMTRFPRQI